MPSQTARAQSAVQQLARVNRINQMPISASGAIGRVQGPAGQSSPLTSITYVVTNASGGTLTYVFGDPNGTVAGAHGATWTQPTSVRNGSVAGVQGSFSSMPVAIKGINYIVSNAAQYSETLMYRYADRDGRYGGQPIDIDAILRNNQYIATRQTLEALEDYVLDTLHCFTLVIPTGVTVTMSFLTGGNVA